MEAPKNTRGVETKVQSMTRNSILGRDATSDEPTEYNTILQRRNTVRQAVGKMITV